MINPEKLVILARETLTELPESTMFSRENLAALIPSAIALWQQQTNNDANKRQNFIQESALLQILQGRVDLREHLDEKGFRLEFIKDSDIEIDYAQNPNLRVKFVSGLNRYLMGGRQDKFFIMAYLSGTVIRFRDPNPPIINVQTGGLDNPLTSLQASFKIRSVVLPSDLSDTPESIAPEIALVLAGIARQQFSEQNRGLNLSPK